jgi:hypothetical protein
MMVVVFLGPSLPHSEAKAILGEAEYRLPAGRGDIVEAVDEGATIIGLIDGVFYQRAAVAHREILYAFEKGVKVVGGSSMGALRASEMDSFGMVGVGLIYRWYKDGVINSDDEVALAFHPDTLVALSEPLVNIRATLAKLAEKGEATKGEAEILLEAAHETPFQLRNYMRIVQKAIEMGLDRSRSQTLIRVLKDERVDQKRLDAVDTLVKIKQLMEFSKGRT